jgi:hypothetical protein
MFVLVTEPYLYPIVILYNSDEHRLVILAHGGMLLPLHALT